MLTGNDDCFEPTGTTARTRAHIKKALKDRLKSEYGCSKVNDFLKIQGFDDSRFDYIGSVANMMYSSVSDMTTDVVDPTANKYEKSFARVQAACDDANHKLLGHDALYRMLKQNVGKEEATRLTAEMYDYTLGINDACHILKVYCWAMSASNLVLQGREGSPKTAPPKHLHSYVSALAGSVHCLANGTLAGALAVADFQICAVYVLLKEGITLEDVRTDPTKRKYIEQMYQQYVYDLHDPSRTGAEPPFSNLSIFGRYKLEGMLAEMGWLFDEYDKSMEYIIDYVMEFQNIMMDFMDKGDPETGLPYTFPVCTVVLSKDDNNELMDQEFIRDFCKRPVNRYNIFVSKGTKVCSCCFDGSQKVLLKTSKGIIYDTFANAFGGSYDFSGTNARVFHNGGWSYFRRVTVPYSDKYYKITTANNKTIIVTKDHLNPTLRGDVRSDELSCDDWLMFSNRALVTSSDGRKELTYADGFAVGLFLGDGSYIKCGDDCLGVNYSLNSGCFSDCKKHIDEFLSHYSSVESHLGSIQHNTHPLVFRSKDAVAFIKGFVNGDRSYNKSLNLDCLDESLEFRKGILAGWYASDGGNSNRCYSVSKDLIDSMEVLCTSLGYATVIDVSDRTGDGAVVIRGQSYDRNYPLYCLRWYESTNKRRYTDLYKIVNNSTYFKIDKIELVDGSSTAYCFEITQNYADEPYFTLPNGVITHNCRLINDVEAMDMASSVNSFGGAGALSMGSHRVVCINMPRLALLSDSMDDFMSRMDGLVKDAVTILRAHKDLIIKLEKVGLQPRITDGTIKLDRLYSTVGILGIWEMFKTLESKFGVDPDRDITVMSAFNKMCLSYGKEAGLLVNLEAIPGESMAVRFAKADRLLFGDKKVPYYIYSNQTVPLTEKVDVFERMDRDGRINLLLTGGGIVHLTIGERVTPEQAEYLIKYAVKSNCEHFALNLVHSECEDGHICEGKYDVCPKCGKPVVDYALRIVGFLRRVSSWSKERQQEFKERYIISNDKFLKN